MVSMNKKQGPLGTDRESSSPNNLLSSFWVGVDTQEKMPPPSSQSKCPLWMLRCLWVQMYATEKAWAV